MLQLGSARNTSNRFPQGSCRIVRKNTDGNLAFGRGGRQVPLLIILNGRFGMGLEPVSGGREQRGSGGKRLGGIGRENDVRPPDDESRGSAKETGGIGSLSRQSNTNAAERAFSRR